LSTILPNSCVVIIHKFVDSSFHPVKFTIYYGFDTFKVLGTIITHYDRIIKVDFNVPIRHEYPYKIIREMEAEEKGIPLETHEHYRSDADRLFSFEIINKGETARRVGKFKYKLVSKELSASIGMNYLYFKPTLWDIIRLRIYLKKYFVLEKDFKTSIYSQIASYILVAGLSIGGTLLTVYSCNGNGNKEPCPPESQQLQKQHTPSKDIILRKDSI